MRSLPNDAVEREATREAIACQFPYWAELRERETDAEPMGMAEPADAADVAVGDARGRPLGDSAERGVAVSTRAEEPA